MQHETTVRIDSPDCAQRVVQVSAAGPELGTVSHPAIIATEEDCKKNSDGVLSLHPGIVPQDDRKRQG